MIAIDTNIVVRFLVRDDRDQSFRARDIMLAQDVFISTTVILETAWVLSKAYGYSRDQLVAGLRSVAGLPRVTLEEPNLFAEALDGLDGGLDFADALHLAKSAGRDGFLTFDKDFVKRARKLGHSGVSLA